MRSVADVFRSLPMAHTVVRSDELPAETRPYDRDEIVLDWEQRLKPRGRRVTTAGVEFATALPRGTVLRHGDCLVLSTIRLIVVIVECDEQVLVIRPVSAAQAAEFAFHIGNSHSPMMIDDGLIVCPELPGMTQLLTYHGIPFVRAERPFTPLGQVVNHRHKAGA